MQVSRKDFFKDNVRDGSYVGKVVDIEDPIKIGRVKVEVFGFWEGLDVALIPWATPLQSITAGSDTGGGFYSVPKLNSIVNVKFDNGNTYCPQYTCIQRISDELKEEISASYENAHSVIYDTESQPGPVKIFFTEEKGLMLDYNGSQVNIRNDNTIYIEHKGGKVIHVQDNHISIGKENESDEPATLGEKNVTALDALATEIVNLCVLLETYAKTQTSVVTAVKPTTIPETRSSTVSVDGPSM